MIQISLRCVSAMAKSRAVIALAFVSVVLSNSGNAHHPDRENQTVHQRVDLIGPVGNRLRPGYRRAYNRPTYWGGKIAYHIAPSSQEAMAWHRAVHTGAYEEPKKHLRLEQHYFYPKPYEVLTVGPRRPKGQVQDVSTSAPEYLPQMLETEPLEEIQPTPDPMPTPQIEPELELPDLDLPEVQPTDEAASPSDSAVWPILTGPKVGRVPTVGEVR